MGSGKKASAQDQGPINNNPANEDEYFKSSAGMLQRNAIEQKYGKRDSIYDYTDEELSGVYKADKLQKIRLEQKLNQVDKSLEEEIKKQEQAVVEEQVGAASLSQIALQRQKRMQTLGRASTVKPVISSGGVAYSNPSKKTLIGS